MIRGLYQIAITTGNLQRLVDFYVNVVGFEFLYENSWQPNPVSDHALGLKNSAAKYVIVRAGNILLEIFEFSSPPPLVSETRRICDRGYTLLGLNVDDVKTEYARLCAAGMKFVSAPSDYGGPGPAMAAFGYDPDGNLIELVQAKRYDPQGHLIEGVDGVI
jgi:catechol 2,3-dioxygenase-like lactoylglutathione lyase family enzyme